MSTVFLTYEEIQLLRQRFIGRVCENACNGSGAILNRTKRVFEDCKCTQALMREIQLLDAGVPERYRDFSLNGLNKKFQEENVKALDIVKNYCVKIEEMVKAGVGLFIQGKSGLAKSAIGYFLIRTGLAHSISGHALAMSDLTQLVYDALFRDIEYRERLVQLSAAPLLFIDEIDKDSDLQKNTLVATKTVRFFNEVYSQRRAMIVTSNKSKAELRGVHAAAVVDRLEELVEVVLVGESYRNQIAAFKRIAGGKDSK